MVIVSVKIRITDILQARLEKKLAGNCSLKFTLIAVLSDDIWRSVYFDLCLFTLATAVETTITEVDVSQGREVGVQENPGRRNVPGNFF